MESICDLLFEQSSEDRWGILHLLRQEGMNVTNLAKKLDITTQESSRHISRLGEVGLTQRDSGGNYLSEECAQRWVNGLYGRSAVSPVALDTHGDP